jgi:MSHA biogenesis protein MshO
VRSAIGRMERELRHALPGSVRVASGCVEFVPVTAVTEYLTLPVETPATTFTVARLADDLSAVSGRAAVYP